MSEAYRAEMLSEAKERRAAARQRLAVARTSRAIRDADESLTFWSNRVAFLEHAER